MKYLAISSISLVLGALLGALAMNRNDHKAELISKHQYELAMSGLFSYYIVMLESGEIAEVERSALIALIASVCQTDQLAKATGLQSDVILEQYKNIIKQNSKTHNLDNAIKAAGLQIAQ